MSSDKRSTPLVFTPLSSEDMLPDERKKIVRKMQAVIHDAGLEPVLIDKLPIDEGMKYAEVPLETVPLITALTEDEATAQNVTQPTAADVAESTAKRASLVVSNAKKAEARTAKLNGYKEQIGNAILNSWSRTAPSWQRNTAMRMSCAPRGTFSAPRTTAWRCSRPSRTPRTTTTRSARARRPRRS